MTTATRLRAKNLLILLFAGGVIGTLVAFALYVTKPTFVALPIVALAAVLPLAFIKNYRLYWLAIFLLSLQFEISKNLNNGTAVIEELKINYTIWNFTFQINVTDLILLVLLAIWANDRLFHGRSLRFPPVAWLAVGYLGICLLSAVGAPSPYLSFVQIFLELKYFVVFLFAVNCLDSKNDLRLLAIVGVVILVTQAGMTAVRFETGYLISFSLGESQQDLATVEKYLAVDRTDTGSYVRGFGTLNSPGSTTRLCLMVIPFGLFMSVRNVMFKAPLVFAALTAFGLLGLALTFTRVYYILASFQCLLAFLLMIRNGMLKRQEVVAIVFLGLVGLAANTPKLYEQFTVREDSVSVRFYQYEAAVNMILDYPLLGVGINNATGEKPKYANVTYNKRDSNTLFYLEPTHNMYLALASEIGLVGALLFFTFFDRVALLAWQQARESADPEIRWVANVLFLVYCSVAISGFMDPFQEYSALVLLWLYAGITFNLARIAEHEETANLRGNVHRAALRRS